MRGTLLLFSVTAFAADLTPDKALEIPAGSRREAVVQQARPQTPLPKHTLPEGYTLEWAAAAPLVTHPIMGCLDERGRLFIGDGVGVNWNKAQLEANPPNRVLLLEDGDSDGYYEKSTIFADKMTFPQGACWLDGSLYVCSPPGLWKLTDADGDGVAEQRKMIVGGFDYTGNAADVHGPFLHPTNGRLYWCHGRKGHEVKQADGTEVHTGLACGIWSCKPDGSDIAWHSLGCGDNPVEVDFTPGGDIMGVQNLYYSQPRGDTLVHWLLGGVYERSDQLKAIAGLPRTLETMPVVYNFGHVAVSGSCFWKRSAFGDALQFMVTHFNTQRLVRVELTPHGATYNARENEFLKLDDPDVHFTDVFEDKDGSLLVVDTGGWFRIGCPSSLMAKPDIAGAIYRIRPAKPAGIIASPAPPGQADLRVCEAIASAANPTPADQQKIMTLLQREDLDATLEHAALYAVMKHGWKVRVVYETANNDAQRRRLLRLAADESPEPAGWALSVTAVCLKRPDKALQKVAGTLLARPGNDPHSIAQILRTHGRNAALEPVIAAYGDQPAVAEVLQDWISGADTGLAHWVLQVLASSTVKPATPLAAALSQQLEKAPTSGLLDALKLCDTGPMDATLQALASDAGQPASLRLKALSLRKGAVLNDETFQWVIRLLQDPTSSAAARIQAAGLLAGSTSDKGRLLQLAPLFSRAGPVELKELIALLRGRLKDAEVGEALTIALSTNPSLASIQESVFRTLYASEQPALFEQKLLPAIQRSELAMDAKKRTLSPLAAKSMQADPAAGKFVFESGQGSCIACHKIGDKGRAIGPDLSHIGSIRTERDLVESILFPSNTLARDYEAHMLELSTGETHVCVIKSHTAEGVLVADAAGIEKTIPHTSIVSDTTLTQSLMPIGLDQTLPEKSLADLVAYLRSLK